MLASPRAEAMVIEVLGPLSRYLTRTVVIIIEELVALISILEDLVGVLGVQPSMPVLEDATMLVVDPDDRRLAQV
jgi:hypothetical protein